LHSDTIDCTTHFKLSVNSRTITHSELRVREYCKSFIGLRRILGTFWQTF